MMGVHEMVNQVDVPAEFKFRRRGYWLCGFQAGMEKHECVKRLMNVNALMSRVDLDHDADRLSHLHVARAHSGEIGQNWSRSVKNGQNWSRLPILDPPRNGEAPLARLVLASYYESHLWKSFLYHLEIRGHATVP